MRYLLEHEPQIHYAQIRPMRTVALSEAQLDTLLNHGHGITMDCSEAVTCLCKWAGLHDPNGLGYDGSGFTGTMLAHLPHYSNPTAAGIGALCVYGPPPGDHVAMVMQPGDDPVMWSHGGEGGPLRVRWSVERAAHRKPYTFLSITHL